jgi:hypothetical protein
MSRIATQCTSIASDSSITSTDNVSAATAATLR